MNIYTRIGLILMAATLFCPLNPVQSAPNSIRVDSLTESPAPEQAPPVSPAATTEPTKPPEKAHELHRLDFRIVGKSCPVCLLSIQNKLKSLNGVQDAAVMLKRPFGASVVYQSDKANSDYILTMLRAKDATIKIFDVKDTKIDKMPEPLIPPFLPAVEQENPIPTTEDKPISNAIQNRRNIF